MLGHILSPFLLRFIELALVLVLVIAQLFV